MVRVLVGSLFDSKAQTLVNAVNCVGVMGKGIALEFKKRFPDMFQDYVMRCEAGRVWIGEPYLYRRAMEPWIVNFPTKRDWRSRSRLEDITTGLDSLERHYREWGVTSLAVPALGCGQGHLEWTLVRPILLRFLSRLEVPVELYAPPGMPVDRLEEDKLDL
jgi:O-acetyl-ADP-ribose deacetylase (regulator of RNase III)